jgi:hypothetical protein
MTRNLLCALAAALTVIAWSIPAWSDEPNADLIAKITGLQPDVKNGVAKVSLPRTDLSVVADGVKMTPFQGLTSWAAFEQAGNNTMVMGDMVLTENQVNPAMSAALDNGLEVTALHNHFFYEEPRIFFMHIGGMGTTEKLATGVRKTLDAAQAAGSARHEGFGGPTIPEKNAIDAPPLEAILGQPGQAKDGMVKFVFAKKTSMHDVDAGAAMGVNTWAAFAGSQGAAVVDGDFAMLEDELQGVLKSLRRSNIDIVAIHNHMTHEEPRIVFLHFWGKGPADALARAVKSAMDTQAK